jgi:hypothetical protein
MIYDKAIAHAGRRFKTVETLCAALVQRICCTLLRRATVAHGHLPCPYTTALSGIESNPCLRIEGDHAGFCHVIKCIYRPVVRNGIR